MTSATTPSLTDGPLAPSASTALGKHQNDSNHVATLRERGRSVAASLPLPTKIERPWKYLDLSELDLTVFSPAASQPTVAAITTPEDGTSGHATFVDGALTDSGSSLDGLKVSGLGAASTEAVGRLGSSVEPERDKFTGLHYAFLQDVAVIESAANVETPDSVRITRSQTTGQFAAPHTLIVTGANSRLTVVEDFTSTDDATLATPIVEIFPGTGAVVRYTTLHRWGPNTQVYANQRTITDRNSELVSVSVATGGSVVRARIESSMEGRGSSSELFGVGAGHDQQHQDFYTVQDHIAPNTRSDLLFKSALKDASRAVYYGITRVGPDGRNADAKQRNQNLLLSKRAKADSDPVLEILTSDVLKCAHGATAGPVDEEQLFYMETRGLSQQEAIALLVKGFLAEVFDRVPDEDLRAEIAELIEERLEVTV